MEEYQKIKKSSDSIMEVFYNVEVYGSYNLPFEYPAILVGNYRSYTDIFTLMYSTTGKINFLTAKSLPGPMSFPLADTIECRKQMLKSLKNNELMNIYLEEKRISKEKEYVFKVAQEVGIPVIPYGIKGTYKLGNKIIINFGEAINFKGCDPEMIEPILSSKIKKLSE